MPRKDVQDVYEFAIELGWQHHRDTKDGGTIVVIPNRPEIRPVVIPNNPREKHALSNCRAALRRGAILAAQAADRTT